MPVRITLDTNVVVSGLLWQGPPRALLQAAREKRIQLFTSPPLPLELANTLARAKFAPKLAATQLTLDELVERYANLSNTVRPSAIAPVVPDPDDDVVIATAISAKSDLIVTGDGDLLGLKQYRNIPIVTTAEAVKRIAAL